MADARDTAAAETGAVGLDAPTAPTAPEAPEAPKPKLRGWLHAAMVPLILAASITMLCLVRGDGGKWAMAVYLAASVILFGNSAAYHLGNWSPGVKVWLRRVDHSNIFLFIAGTYTPLGVLLLDGGSRIAILAVIWAAALAGIFQALFWIHAPRWLTAAIYVFMGWAAVWWLPQLWVTGGPAVVWLLLAGGILYSLGAFVYAKKWPDPWPKWFGFHEVFHSCTILAAACHFTAISLAVATTWS
jgi:hemolysin III